MAFVSLRASDFVATIQGWDIDLDVRIGSRKVVRIGSKPNFAELFTLSLVDLTLSRIIYHLCDYAYSCCFNCRAHGGCP